MGHKERFNARARASSRPKKRAKISHKNEENDTNTDIHVPKTQEQKDEDRRERLRQELLEQQNSKVSSKKKRRLEKYIDKKLQKEERVQLFEKLAQSQAQLPDVLHLQPSSTLGSRKAQTNEDLLSIQEDKEVRKMMEGRVNGKRRRRGAFTGVDDLSEEEEDEDFSMESSAQEPKGDTFIELQQCADTEEYPDKTQSIATREVQNVQVVSDVGSALRRNADGSIQAPKIVKRKPKGSRTIFKRWNRDKPAREEDSDSSFDSSDSEMDTPDEAEEEEEEGGDDGADDVDDQVDEEGEGEGEEGEDTTEGQSEEDSDILSEEDNQSSIVTQSKRKRLGFKDWALQQVSASKGYVAPVDAEERILVTLPETKGEGRRKSELNEMRGPLGEELRLPETALAEQFKPPPVSVDAPNQQKVTSKFVSVKRPDDVQVARLELPILAEEQTIIETIRLNPVIILCGATGSGKTTQVPQFLYEAGFGCSGSENPGMIGITQPRRVAAMSMAARVGHELSLSPAQVAYQVRYDATTSPSTIIKFMTDGVLLRELASDFTLDKYSVIIVDEAHERSVNTDILIGTLSRVVRLREELWKEGKDGAKPLRLIIMSATLRVSDFAENPVLFSKPPPVISVDARQHPVAIHFARRTHPDYVSEAIKKASKIHSCLPPGGILIFLTGQNEITGVCRKLESRYGRKAIAARKRRQNSQLIKIDGDMDDHSKSFKIAPALADVELEEIDLGDFHQDAEVSDDEGEPRDLDPEGLDTDEEEEENRALGIDSEESEVPMHVLPLYSILPTEEQMKVFKPPPSDSRLVVVATNVAETSLTIPGIRYVIDCGRAKERCFDVSSGVQSFRVNWVSKASADQRAGRAGRTGPGHCYRLYSSALFEHHFDKFSKPEILQMPIEGVVLQMKSMNIDTVTNFPFPTPPDRNSLQKAEVLLTRLGALKSGSIISQPLGSSSDRPITDLGKAMALFPLSPRFARMIVSGRQHGCMPYVIAMVAALSVGDPFLHEESLQDNGNISEGEDEEPSLIKSEEEKKKEMNKLRRRAFFKSTETHSRLGKGLSDIFRLLSVVGAYEFSRGGHEFCRDHFVRAKAMEEIHKLRAQISSIASTNFLGLDTGITKSFRPPSELQIKVMRQLLCSAFIDQVAVRKDLVQSTSITGNKYATCRGIPYRALGISEDVFIHPSSILHNKSPPDYIIFQEAVQSNQLWLKNITVINPAWLTSLGKGSLCRFSKPERNSAGELMVIPHFGPEGWELPAVKASTVL